jgi:hypothetical protein
MKELPLACSLGAEDLETRLARIREIGSDALLGHETVDDVHRLRFRADAGVRARLESVIAAEAACCSFLDLGLEGDGGELILSIAAPADAEPVAAELARAFTRGAGIANSNI